MWNHLVYKTINVFKSPNTLKLANQLSIIPNHNRILDNLYLGNLVSAHNEQFFKDHQIRAILNCTVKEEFHPYFLNKPKFRLDVEDSRTPENIAKFRAKLYDCVSFIEDEIKRGNVVYVHCYWGLMRCTTVLESYLTNIHHLKQKRPQALSSLYNYNDLLEDFYQKYCLIDGNEERL